MSIPESNTSIAFKFISKNFKKCQYLLKLHIGIITILYKGNYDDYYYNLWSNYKQFVTQQLIKYHYQAYVTIADGDFIYHVIAQEAFCKHAHVYFDEYEQHYFMTKHVIDPLVKAESDMYSKGLVLQKERYLFYARLANYYSDIFDRESIKNLTHIQKIILLNNFIKVHAKKNRLVCNVVIINQNNIQDIYNELRKWNKNYRFIYVPIFYKGYFFILRVVLSFLNDLFT